jgi:hypothetical protein
MTAAAFANTPLIAVAIMLSEPIAARESRTQQQRVFCEVLAGAAEVGSAERRELLVA